MIRVILILLVMVTYCQLGVAQGESKLEHKISKKWIVNRIILNGVENQEDYPTNNDELILKNDGSFILLDKVYNYSELGAWRIIKEDILYLEILGDEDESRFKIVYVDDKVMELRLLGVEYELIIYYDSK